MRSEKKLRVYTASEAKGLKMHIPCESKISVLFGLKEKCMHANIFSPFWMINISLLRPQHKCSMSKVKLGRLLQGHISDFGNQGRTAVIRNDYNTSLYLSGALSDTS